MSVKLKWEPGYGRDGSNGRVLEWQLKGKLGKDYTSNNAHEIESGWHYNGSGAQAFGGAASWPHAKLDVSFQTGEEAKRDAFVEALKKFVADYFKTQ